MPLPHMKSRKGSPGGRINRIDPKQIPRPKETKVDETSVRYHTRSKTLPPPVNSAYTVVDEGNASPRFIRLTSYNFPQEQSIVDKTKIQLGAIIQPLAEVGKFEVPVNLASYPGGPIRCSRCAAYINPFFKFINSGHTFICNMCGANNDCPDDFKCNLDANGLRRDHTQRPELCRGSVEFCAGEAFIARPIQDPCYLFVIDVSYGAIVTGLVLSACNNIRNALETMKNNSRIRVGIVTYGSEIHFYSLKSTRVEPCMLVVTDIDEPFAPCPSDEVLVRPSDPDAMELIDSLLDMIPAVFDQASATEPAQLKTCAGAAMQVGVETLKPYGGKLILMQSYIGNCGAGALTNRDDVNMYGAPDKEKTLLVPQHDLYTRIGTEAAENAISIDLFICANSYVDLATIGQACSKTGGQTFMYPGFNHAKDAEAFHNDLFHTCTRNTGWDGIMVVRTSTGLRVAEHFGNYYRRSAAEMDLASIDGDKAFGVRLEFDAKLSLDQEACLQVALLYTNMQGQRRIRVHTISVPVTNKLSTVFRYTDLDAIINLSLKQAVRQILSSHSPTEARAAVTESCVQSLFTYRKFCASATSAGQLILPEPLKLLPLSTLGLVKNPVFQLNLGVDQRSFLSYMIAAMPAKESAAFVTPRLFSIHDIPHGTLVYDSEGRITLPRTKKLSSESLNSQGVYFLDDSRFLYLWIGEAVDPNVYQQLFGVQPGHGIKPDLLRPVATDDPHLLHVKVHNLIGLIRKNKPAWQNFQTIARSQSHHNSQETLDESMFYSHLIEDGKARAVSTKGKKKSQKLANKIPMNMSYIDFLCHVHKSIQSRF